MRGAKGAEGAKGAKGNAALYMRNAPALHMPSKLQCSVVEASNDLQTATKELEIGSPHARSNVGATCPEMVYDSLNMGLQ